MSLPTLKTRREIKIIKSKVHVNATCAYITLHVSGRTRNRTSYCFLFCLVHMFGSSKCRPFLCRNRKNAAHIILTFLYRTAVRTFMAREHTRYVLFVLVGFHTVADGRRTVVSQLFTYFIVRQQYPRGRVRYITCSYYCRCTVYDYYLFAIY